MEFRQVSKRSKTYRQGTQAVKQSGPGGKQGRAKQRDVQTGIQQSKQAECCCVKLSGPEARQTHRGGRVMLMLFKTCTRPLFHRTGFPCLIAQRKGKLFSRCLIISKPWRTWSREESYRSLSRSDSLWPEWQQLTHSRPHSLYWDCDQYVSSGTDWCTATG